MSDRLFTDTPPAPPFDAAPAGALAVGGRVTVSERVVTGANGAAGVPVTVLSPAGPTVDLPVVLYLHGGAWMLDNRYMDLDRLLPYVTEAAAVVVSVACRFAPEHAAPAQLEDCYSALLWTVENAAELGIDPERITVMGIGAGGALALGVSLLARDRGGPAIGHQVLVEPMLAAASGRPDVSPYVAPARMDDLSDLPRTFLDCGIGDRSRDEAVVLATRLCGAGVLVDLHLWGEGFEGEFIRRAIGARTMTATGDRRCAPPPSRAR